MAEPAVAIVVPFPAQGHLNQALQLSRLLSRRKIPVHYVCSDIHIRQLKQRADSLDPLEIANIQFRDFPIPPFSSPLPDPYAPSKFPSHLQPVIEAFMHLREPIAALFRSLSPTAKRLIIIHDSLIASIIQDARSIPNAEVYTFHTISPFTIFCNTWEAVGKPFKIDPEVENNLPSNKGCFSSDFTKLAIQQYEFMDFQAGDLYNTCRFIDGNYIDLLAKLKSQEKGKQWAIGPLNPLRVHNQSTRNKRHKCLEWLDKQNPKSVLYISFGSTTSLSEEEIKELATALEESKTKFIWVVRDADKGNIFSEARQPRLPEGFEKRTERSGIVVRGWAPQLEILGHRSTGGFMSHCGWNSCMESMSQGVPMAAWPMHSDQPRNAMLLTQVLKVGVVVKEWAEGKHVVNPAAMTKAIRGLMASEKIRKRAQELGEDIRRQFDTEDGVPREFESFIAHITR